MPSATEGGPHFPVVKLFRKVCEHDRRPCLPCPLLGAGANERQPTRPSGRHGRAEACLF